MRYQFEQCISKGKIVKISIDPDLISKEMKEAGNDLEACEKSLKESNFKWTIIQAYYSMFHSFRALIFSKGFREKSHICLKPEFDRVNNMIVLSIFVIDEIPKKTEDI